MTCDDTDTENVYNYLGLVGSLILSFSIILQVYKTYKHKTADDLSYKWLLSSLFGLTLVNIYAVNFNLWSIYIPGFLELLFILILTYLKKIYSAFIDGVDIR